VAAPPRPSLAPPPSLLSANSRRLVKITSCRFAICAKQRRCHEVARRVRMRRAISVIMPRRKPRQHLAVDASQRSDSRVSHGPRVPIQNRIPEDRGRQMLDEDSADDAIQRDVLPRNDPARHVLGRPNLCFRFVSLLGCSHDCTQRKKHT
jgi:hypothetical protein